MLRPLTVLLLGTLLAAPGIAFAQQQGASLDVTADQVTYDANRQTVEAVGHVRLRYRGIRLTAEFVLFDLRAEQLTARGQVVIIDPRGRTLRGVAASYDVRVDRAEIEQAETVVDGFTVRAERLVSERSHLLARGASVTPCDPERPALQLTAEEIDVLPGQRLIARRASLWVGGRRVLTLPTYTVSLRSGAQSASSFPRVGYSTIDGLWAEYRWTELLGTDAGYALARVGTLGQHVEVGVDFPNVVPPGGPVAILAGANVGWHREQGGGVMATRWQYQVGFQTRELVLSPRTAAHAGFTWQDATYSTGDRQQVLRGGAALTHSLRPGTTVSLTYDVVNVWGATPLQVDAIADQDRINQAGLQYAHSGRRGDGILTSFGAGTTYYFRDHTRAVNLSYGERVSERYHWTLGTEYNLDSRTTKVSADLGHSVGYRTYFTVQGVYNTSTRVFEDLDYIVTSNLCNCFDVSFKYRQMRQEIWLQVGLTLPQRQQAPTEVPAP